jgi:hypothetical protein
MPPKLLGQSLKLFFSFAFILFQFSFALAQGESGSVLVGHWKLDEASGTTLSDNSGSGNNAILQTTVGITRVTGIYGLAMNMAGSTNSFAIAPNQASLNITDKITIAAWIRPVELATRTILSKSGPDGYELSVTATGNIEFRFNYETSGSKYRILSNGTYPSNGTTWMHVAATYDGATSKIYLNGVLDISVTFPIPSSIKTNTSGLYIGSLITNRKWKGTLDDIRLYHGALTASEVVQAMNNGAVTPLPAAPVLASPANTATNIALNPTLNWNTVSGATKYRLEISELQNFSTTFLAQDDIATTSFQVSNLLSNKIYYWRVRASNGGGDGPWSATWSFTTAPPVPPSAPVLLAPANASTNIPTSTAVSWNTVIGATKYRLEVSELSDFTTTFLAQDNIATTSFQLTNLLVSKTYYWRVRGVNSGGDGSWSTVWSFTTAAASVPGSELVGHWKLDESSGGTLTDNSGLGNNATLQNTVGVTRVAGVYGMALNLAGTTNAFAIAPNQASLNITDKITIAAWIRPTELSTRTILSKSNPDGYELAIAANGKIEFRFNYETSGSKYRILSIGSYPANGTTWMHVAATYDGATSKIYLNGVLDVSVTFTTPASIKTNTSGLYIGALLTSRRWKGTLDDVRLYHGALTANEVVQVMNNSGATPLPAAPVLASPVNAASNVANNPTLSWNAATGATKYRLEVSELPDFTTTFLTQDNIATASLQITNLLPARVYYWRVRGSNAGGDGPWSAVWNFTTVPAAPVAPVLSTPANASTNIPVNTTVSWNAVSGATKYRLEVSELQDFSTTFLAQDDIATTSLQLSNLLANKLYYWRVRASNSGGDGPWSAVWSFTTASAQQPTLTLIHYWNFNGATVAEMLTPSITVNSGTITETLIAGSTSEVGTANNFTGVNARHGDAIGNHYRLNVPIGSVLTFNISTIGYKDVIVRYETRRSTTGSEIQKVSYSLDGSAYIPFQTLHINNINPELITLDFSAITGVNDNANFKVRIEFEQGAGTLAGNNRFDNLTVEGNTLGGVVPLPDQVITTLPANNAQSVILKPDFSWQAALNATSYKLQVSTDNQFSSIVFEKTIAGQTTYKTESALTIGTNYFWRVRGNNSTGDGPWSDVKTFQTIQQVIVYKLGVNEVMSSNTNTVADEDGSFEDWVELVNYGTTPINLQGFGLSDTYATPFKWVFPAKTIAPGEFLIVWSSSKNRVDPANPLHTSFGISAQGEEVVLTAPDGERVDSIPKVAIPTNVSRGHEPDGNGALKFFTVPTPGATNTGGVTELITKAVFSQAPGIYPGNITLSITHPDPLVTIRYTLDGTEPTAASTLYQQPLQIIDRSGDPNGISMIPTNFLTAGDSRAWVAPNGLVRKGTIVRAKAFKGNESESQITTGTFIVLPGRQYTMPVISVILPPDSLFGFDRGLYVPGTNYFTGDDGSGNYYRKGDDWERPGSVEFFSPSLTFQQNLGYRINGDFSRRFPQKSLRLVPKSKYGPNSLDYPFFTNYASATFKRLELTNGGNDWGNTLFKDAIASSLVSHIMPAEHNRPSIVFLNGEYWGIHNIREHTDKYQLAKIYGVDPDNIDYLSRDAEIEEGEDVYYKELLNYVQTTDLTTDGNFEGVKQRMDVDNYLDYFSSEIYYANTDWPQSNIEYWRARTNYNPAAPLGQDGRWRWILHDLDQTFVNPQYNSISWVTAVINPTKNSTWPNLLLRSLLTNQNFKYDFINRIADHLNTAFIPARITTAVDSVKAIIQPEMAEHILRWKQPSSVSSWNGKADAVKTFATQRPGYLRQHLITAFTLGSTLTVTLNVNDKIQGSIKINSLTISNGAVGVNAAQPYPWQGVYFGNVPLKLKALPSPGFVFDHWLIDGQVFNTEGYNFTPAANASVTAFFVATTGVKPVLISPANAVKNVAKTPASFTWQAVAQATSYRLQVSLAPDFLTTVSDQSGIAATNADVIGLLDSALYYWRVMAVGANGSSDWSDTRSFTTVPATVPYPAIVTLATPLKGATNVAINPTLSWNAAANATYYTVNVSETSDFDDYVVNKYNITSLSLPSTGLQRNKVYYWRVKSTNDRGSSAWSEIRKFTTASITYGTDLVGHWKLNEEGGKYLLDNSGFGNHAALQTLDEVDWLAAVEAFGLRLLGSTNMFAIAPNSPSLNITNQVTIAAWVKPTELSTRTILSKTGTDGYELSITSGGQIEFRINADTKGSTYRILSTSTYPFNGVTWMHVAATFDGASSKIYINGVLDKSVTFAIPTTINSNTSGLYIGSLLGARRWKGMLDDILLYNRALSAAEIQQLVSPQVVSPPIVSSKKVMVIEETEKLKMYPNPVSNKINLDFKQETSGKVAIAIHDASGRTYLQSNETVSNNRVIINLADSKLKPGIYFLEVKSPTSSQVMKFLKE